MTARTPWVRISIVTTGCIAVGLLGARVADSSRWGAAGIGIALVPAAFLVSRWRTPRGIGDVVMRWAPCMGAAESLSAAVLSPGIAVDVARILGSAILFGILNAGALAGTGSRGMEEEGRRDGPPHP